MPVDLEGRQIGVPAVVGVGEDVDMPVAQATLIATRPSTGPPIACITPSRQRRSGQSIGETTDLAVEAGVLVEDRDGD